MLQLPLSELERQLPRVQMLPLAQTLPPAPLSPRLRHQIQPSQ